MDKKDMDKLCANKPTHIKVSNAELHQLLKYANEYIEVKETLAGPVYSYKSIQLFVV